MQSQKFPQENSSNLPSRKLIRSRFRKLLPSRFWKLITCRARTSLPDFIQRLFPHQGITGLFSANCHGKIVLGEVLPIPSGVRQIFQQSSTMVSPAELSSTSQRSISSHRVIPRRVISSPGLFPNEVIFFYRFILTIITPSGSGELYSSTSAQDLISRPVIKDLFS